MLVQSTKSKTIRLHSSAVKQSSSTNNVDSIIKPSASNASVNSFAILQPTDASSGAEQTGGEENKRGVIGWILGSLAILGGVALLLTKRRTTNPVDSVEAQNPHSQSVKTARVYTDAELLQVLERYSSGNTLYDLNNDFTKLVAISLFEIVG